MSDRWLYLRYFTKIAPVLLISLFIGACSTSSKNGDEKKIEARKDLPNEFAVLVPVPDQTFILGQSLKFVVTAKSSDSKPDSVAIYTETAHRVCISDSTHSFTIQGLLTTVGLHNLRVHVFLNNKQTETFSIPIRVISDSKPKELKYSVLKTLPHDINSYTQGLLFYTGLIYESTGRTGYSKVRKIDPSNGSVLLDRNIDEQVFGEGITILNNKLYQITYHSGVGYIYDPNSLELLQQFDLQVKEGWGITSDDKYLIMSEGSSILYFFDPVYFTLQGQMEVCDDKGSVSRLNELEYVNNAIWANVYTEPYLVKIDFTTGKVLATVNLKDLYPKGMPNDFDHVLNGIAYHEPSNSFYITGKLWPYIYQIKIFDE